MHHTDLLMIVALCAVAFADLYMLARGNDTDRGREEDVSAAEKAGEKNPDFEEIRGDWMVLALPYWYFEHYTPFLFFRLRGGCPHTAPRFLENTDPRRPPGMQGPLTLGPD